MTAIKATWFTFIDSLLSEEPTTALEAFLATVTMIAGLWILSPWWSAFPLPTTLLYFAPESITGTIVATQGLLHVCSIRYSKRPWMRRYLLWNAGLWAAITYAYAAGSAHTVLLVPIASCFTTASFLLYIRLDILYRGR